MNKYMSDNFFHEMYRLIFGSPLVLTFIAGAVLIVYQYYVTQQREQQSGVHRDANNIPNSEMTLWSSVNLNPRRDIRSRKFNYNIKQSRRTPTRTLEANNSSESNSGNQNFLPSRNRENAHRGKRKKPNVKEELSEKTNSVTLNLNQNFEAKRFVKNVNNPETKILNTKILNTDDFQRECSEVATVETDPIVLNVGGKCKLRTPVETQVDAMATEFDADFGQHSTQMLGRGNLNFDEGLEVYIVSSSGEIESTSVLPHRSQISNVSCVKQGNLKKIGLVKPDNKLTLSNQTCQVQDYQSEMYVDIKNVEYFNTSEEISNSVLREEKANPNINFRASSNMQEIDNEIADLKKLDSSYCHDPSSSGDISKTRIPSVNDTKNEKSSKSFHAPDLVTENCVNKNTGYFDAQFNLFRPNDVLKKEQKICMIGSNKQKPLYEITDFKKFGNSNTRCASAPSSDANASISTDVSASTSFYDDIFRNISLSVAIPETQAKSDDHTKKLFQSSKSFQITDAASEKCVGNEAAACIKSEVQLTLVSAVTHIQLINPCIQHILNYEETGNKIVDSKEISSSSGLYPLSSSTGAISKRQDRSTVKYKCKKDKESSWDQRINLMVDFKKSKKALKLNIPISDLSSTIVSNQQSSSDIDDPERYSYILEERVRKLERIFKVPDTASNGVFANNYYESGEIPEEHDHGYLYSIEKYLNIKSKKRSLWAKMKNKFNHAKERFGATVATHLEPQINTGNVQNSNYEMNTGNTDYSVYDSNDETLVAEGGAQSSFTVSEQDLCIGCDEVFADSVYFPCGHSYLCYQCAQTVSQIYKRCCVCNETIDSIQHLGS